ncbi:hepatocyte growth factor receptor-like isoform X1 [Ixodes scapularis]|uniref:hepatocyte growth factor receptor-like isoform X1 n=2 Tax=Ixodes scapularis TaxID=6945 RepID=UPI001C37F895|nr:hepatocyte growth factor receptor-like isoform X1 [Ixodes scapularis]
MDGTQRCTIWVAALVLLASVHSGTDIVEFQVEDGPLQNVIYLNIDGGVVVVGGRNALYKLSPDLDLEAKESTGPRPDNPQCTPDPLECAQGRTLTDNDNQVLLQLGPAHPLVLACGTIWQGICSLYVVRRNVTVSRTMDKKLYVNYVASRVSTVAFFQGATLFAASTYDGRPLDYHPFSVSARDLNSNGSFKLHSSDDSSASFVNVDRTLKKSYKVRYVYAMSHDGFAYFVTVQNAGLALELFETRIARVCLDDPTFLTYTELPVRCAKGESRFPIAQAASAGPESQGGDRLLLVAFGRPSGGRMQENDASAGSAVCSFRMHDVEEAFRKAVDDCNAAKPTSKVSHLFHTPGTPQDCTRYDPVDKEDLCTPGVNNYIEGKTSLSGTQVVHLQDRLVTSVTALQQNMSDVAWIGDNKGFLYKYKLEGSASTLLYSTDLSGGIETAIEKSTAVDPNGTYAYFLTGKKVVRFPVGSCSIYERCSVCMNSTRDPLVCGWCGSQCAHFGECTPSTAFDLQRCPILLKKVSPTKGPSSGGTLLTLEGDNFGSPAHKPDSSIQITVGKKPCALVLWNYTFVQCKTPAGQSDSLVDIVVAVNDTHWFPGKSFDVIDKKVAATGFEYQMSTFSGISPSYGPRAGGTSIAVHGTNLDSGALQIVSVGSHPCHIYSVTNLTILCSTSRLEGSHPGGDETHRVTLTIDGQEVPYLPTEGLTATFSYKPNPVIKQILPASAPFKGRSKVLVLGENLDSVVKPVMVTRVTSLNYRHHEHISKECVPADDGQSLACPVASLFDSSVIPRDQLQNHRDSIWVQVHFQMDGLRLPERAAGMDASFKFVYRPPPKFDPFPPGGLNVRANDPTVLIRGHNFEVLEHDDQFSVMIDDVDHACDVINITSTTIVCYYKIYEKSEDAAHTVDVVMGNETFRLGALKLVSGQASSHTGTIAGVVIAVFIITLIVVGAFFYYKRRLPNKRTPGYFVEYDNRNGENGGRPPGENDYVRGNEADARQALIASSFQLDDETKAMLEAEKLLFKREFLTLGPVIGQGHFGCVYRGTLELEGKGEVQSVAVKTLHNNSRGGEADGQAFLEEALIMKDFHHMNVLPLIGLSIDEGGQLMVIIPYMKYGDLLSYIREERNSPTVKDLITYGIHVAEGMKYLSDTKFVHRDLAARNCMLSEDFIVRVADFGLSRDVYEKDYYSGDNKKTKLPVKWMAPESLEKGIYNHKTDVWAYGVLLWELMTRGVTPYPEVDNWDIINFLQQGRRMQQPTFCPTMLYEIMLQCWDHDPKKRPSFARLVTDVSNVIRTMEKESRNKRVSLNVTYVNYPLPDDSGAGPSGQGDASSKCS